MILRTDGIKFLEANEGFRTHAYPDSKGIWTIGVGSTYYLNGISVKKGDVLTSEQAYDLFHSTVISYENKVSRSILLPITQTKYDALVSFSYNVGLGGFGGSTLVRQINKGLINDKEEMKRCFMMWTKDIELIPRREREVVLFNDGLYTYI